MSFVISKSQVQLGMSTSSRLNGCDLALPPRWTSRALPFADVGSTAPQSLDQERCRDFRYGEKDPEKSIIELTAKIRSFNATSDKESQAKCGFVIEFLSGLRMIFALRLLIVHMETA